VKKTQPFHREGEASPEDDASPGAGAPGGERSQLTDRDTAHSRDIFSTKEEEER